MINHEYESYMINALRNIGADYQKKYGSMIFAKNGLVMVVDYNEYLDRCIGTIMTYYVYSELCEAYENSCSKMTLACFAWSYRWGHDFVKETHMDAVPAFQYALTIESAPYWCTNQVGYVEGDVIYLVREYVNDLPNGEYGVRDLYYLVGAFTDIDTAAKVVHATKTNKAVITIIPVLLNVTYGEGEKMLMGGRMYIE